MRRYLALTLACALAAVSVSALALGLGDIRLNSYLNQRLDAEIELVSAAADELESLKIQLADHRAYERYGLDRSPILNTLDFRVVRRPNGTAYLKVTSSESIKEPFLTFLIEASWSRGRMLREYTVLLDPPTFAGRDDSRPEAAVAQAPVVTPERQPQPLAIEPEVRRAQPRPVEQPRVAEETVGDVISIPSLDSEIQESRPADRVAAPRFPAPQETAGTYGPIQRNETLWGIAMRLRPDESVTVNQMMIALYRANPEAFQGNINRLKAGYILRVPDSAEIRGISRVEAFREAREHNEQWQGGRSGAVQRQEAVEPRLLESEPELSLVAPTDDLLAPSEAELDAGGELDAYAATGELDLDATGEGGESLGLELDSETPERLLDLENESLQALQSQESEIAELDAPALPEGFDADESVLDGEELAIEEPVIEEPVVETTPVQDPRTAPPVVQRRVEPSLVEQIMAVALSPLGMGIAAAILVLLLAGLLVVRRRRAASGEAAAAEMADWDAQDGDAMVIADEFEKDGSGDSTDTVFATDFGDEHAETSRLEDDADATQLLADADKTQMLEPEQPPSFEDTMVGGQAVTLDENDPLSEADFHMAYGLYDQAAEVVQKAVDRDPSRKDWHAKLAEIHFAGNNKEGFLSAARQFHGLAGSNDADWNNIAIMGRQLAPGDELFANGGTTGEVDLDFGSAASEFDGEETVVNESSSEPEAAASDSDTLDFDISFETSEAPAAVQADAETASSEVSESGGLDFDLDVGDLSTSDAGNEAGSPTAASDTSSDFDFDLGDLGHEEESAPTSAVTTSTSETANELDFNDADTQTEFDKALEELSAYVDTNLPETDAGDSVDSDSTDESDLNLDDYSFDRPDGMASDESEDLNEEEDDIGEIGTKLDLARAYIDMGDPDGARGILEEVLADGDDDQKQEAQQLMDQIG